MTFVEKKNLKKQFGAIQVLKGIDFSVESGQVVAIIGRSGSGKHLAADLEWTGKYRRRVDRNRRRTHGRSSCRSARAALESRHGIPAVQPVPASHRRTERDARADRGEEGSQGKGARDRRASA